MNTSEWRRKQEREEWDALVDHWRVLFSGPPADWHPPRDYGWVYPIALFVVLIAWIGCP
jgi:hypothetical protein